jgi:fructose-1,6-bisphosphatase/inositol monophosphatase family enzyme
MGLDPYAQQIMIEITSTPEFGIENPIAQKTLDTLKLVCQKHREMGSSGRDKDVINQFGEQALRADLSAEETVLHSFREYAESKGITLEVHGEETGKTTLGTKGEKYFAVLDGLDGSSNYLHPNTWSYGTMFSIAKGSNPTYADFEVAGIGFPEENKILLGVKGDGVYVYDIESKMHTKLKPFSPSEFEESKILSDNYFSEAKKMLGQLQDKWPRTGSTAASLAALAIGDQVKNSEFPEMNKHWQGLVEVTRKGNLEQPALYIILSELGGVMVDKNGKDIGSNLFKEWGQDEKVPVISAQSQRIADNIISRLTK